MGNPTIKKVLPALSKNEQIPGPALGNQLRRDKEKTDKGSGSCAPRAPAQEVEPASCAPRASGSDGKAKQKATVPVGPKKDQSRQFVLDRHDDSDAKEENYPSSEEEVVPNCPNRDCVMCVEDDQILVCEICQAMGCFMCTAHRAKDVPGGVCLNCFERSSVAMNNLDNTRNVYLDQVEALMSATALEEDQFSRSATQVFMSRRPCPRRGDFDSEEEETSGPELDKSFNVYATRPSEAKRQARINASIRVWSTDNGIAIYPSYQVISRKRSCCIAPWECRGGPPPHTIVWRLTLDPKTGVVLMAQRTEDLRTPYGKAGSENWWTLLPEVSPRDICSVFLFDPNRRLERIWAGMVGELPTVRVMFVADYCSQEKNEDSARVIASLS